MSKTTEYKGYSYQPDSESDGDTTKIYHMVETPEGESVMVDWSPNSSLKLEDFHMWVDLGCPKRTGVGPLNREELLKIAERLDEERSQIDTDGLH